MKKKSQNDLILEYMKDHKGITTLEAFKMWKITRLSGRIYELKRQGHQIGEAWEETETARYKRYFLLEAI